MKIYFLICIFIFSIFLLSCESDFTTNVDPKHGFNEPMLSEPYPNPFQTSVAIQYQVPKQQLITLVVQNPLGDIIRNLTSKEHAAGLYQYIWNGKNDQGEEVDDGFYFVTLKAGSFLSSQVLKKE